MNYNDLTSWRLRNDDYYYSKSCVFFGMNSRLVHYYSARYLQVSIKSHCINSPKKSLYGILGMFSALPGESHRCGEPRTLPSRRKAALWCRGVVRGSSVFWHLGFTPRIMAIKYGHFQRTVMGKTWAKHARVLYIYIWFYAHLAIEDRDRMEIWWVDN